MEFKELVSQAKDFLSMYEYAGNKKYSTDSVDTIIDEWMENKKDIINLFEKHPNYNGRYQIVLTENYERKVDYKIVESMLREFLIRLNVIDVEGDIYRPTILFIDALVCLDKSIKSTIDSEIVDRLKSTYHYTNNEAYAAIVNGLHIGQKLSRVMRKLLVETPVAKDEDFEKLYARFSDGLNPLNVERYTILSVNPIDYWSMSFGNSWTSCHTIDKTNIRCGTTDGYHGMYSGGTQSYMLDSVSVVMYTIDKNSDISRPELCDKITRQMLHIGSEFFIQGRLYPQYNDEDTDEYKKMREIAQRVISQCEELPNYWVNKKGIAECMKVSDSKGPHYRDYLNFGACNVSYNKAFEGEFKKITIGNHSICPKCGKRHYRENNIMCTDCSVDMICTQCGEEISDDEYYNIDGHIFCCYECAEDYGYVYIDGEGYRNPDDDDVHWDENYEEYFIDYGDAVYIDGYGWYMDYDSAYNAGFRFVDNEGEWYPEEEVAFCDRCCEYFLEDSDQWSKEHDCCVNCIEEGDEE